jgi:Ca2+-binding RTX toxin-like protein
VLAAISPASALAADVWRSGSKVSYRAAAGEVNSLTIVKVRQKVNARGKQPKNERVLERSLFRFTDATGPLTAGAGCVQESPHTVTCPASGIRSLWVAAGDGDDQIINNTATRSHLSGGDGDDRLLGGFAADTIRGGRGEDVQLGRAGDDTILTRGTFADRVSCGGGSDAVAADRLDTVEPNCEDIVRAAAVASAVARTSP